MIKTPTDLTDYLDDMPPLDIEMLEPSDVPLKEIEVFIEGIDPRLQLISHSSRSTLHKCPRKFQLYRLNSLEQEQADTIANDFQQLTFDFGSVVGMGIQAILAGDSLDQLYLDCFLYWSIDIHLENKRQHKSFWEALFAIQRFKAIIDAGYLKDYELLTFISPETGEEKLAVELSFQILLPDGYKYRGYVDAVLRHKLTGEVMILEDKTTYMREVNPATYKNSGQGLGYSVVLDHIVEDALSSYTVLYLVYSTTLKEFQELPFEKSSLQRALWLNELLIDCKHIDLYEQFGVYPMHGESCFDFFRECEYLGLCTLSTERLVKPLTQKVLDNIEKKEVYDFTIQFEELIQTQINMIKDGEVL